MAANIAEVKNYSQFQIAKYLWGNTQLLLCRPSYLITCVSSPHHYGLEIHQLHELEIFIRCTL